MVRVLIDKKLKNCVNLDNMEARQENLLKVIVEEYIQSACPVGSNLVVEKHYPELSSATVRNVMAELDELGLTKQPHISAGRVPTLAGYKYYIDKFVGEGELSPKNQKSLTDLAGNLKDDREGVKSLAKELAELSGEAIFVSFNHGDIFYTGLSNLFRQPEFANADLLLTMSELIDHLDQVLAKIFSRYQPDEVQILIGRKNPFGEAVSAVLVKSCLTDDEIIIGVLGPNRMDYQANRGLMREVKKIIENL